MPTTYEPIQTTTLTSGQSSITFTSISQAYTDIVMVFDGDISSLTGCGIRVGNGSLDTGYNYSLTRIWARDTGTYGTSRESGSIDSLRWDYWAAGNGNPRNAIFHFQNYSNTTTNKTILIRTNMTGEETLATVGMWRQTSAINQISLMFSGSATYTSGSSATLYGIKAA
jgi:hypothetical protein